MDEQMVVNFIIFNLFTWENYWILIMQGLTLTEKLTSMLHVDSTHNICPYKEIDKKSTDCNLNTTELLDCVLLWGMGMGFSP